MEEWQVFHLCRARGRAGGRESHGDKAYSEWASRVGDRAGQQKNGILHRMPTERLTASPYTLWSPLLPHPACFLAIALLLLLSILHFHWSLIFVRLCNYSSQKFIILIA